MEEMDAASVRKQYYMITQDDCDALRDIQAMILAMMPDFSGDGDIGEGGAPAGPPCGDIQRCLADVSVKIGRVLDSVCWKNIQRPRGGA